MYCSHCGKQMDPTARFCSACGAVCQAAPYARGPIFGQLTRPRYPRVFQQEYAPDSPCIMAGT